VSPQFDTIYLAYRLCAYSGGGCVRRYLPKWGTVNATVPRSPQ
jgi:hypothetical protein